MKSFSTSIYRLFVGLSGFCAGQLDVGAFVDVGSCRALIARFKHGRSFAIHRETEFGCVVPVFGNLGCR